MGGGCRRVGGGTATVSGPVRVRRRSRDRVVHDLFQEPGGPLGEIRGAVGERGEGGPPQHHTFAEDGAPDPEPTQTPLGAAPVPAPGADPRAEVLHSAAEESGEPQGLDDPARAASQPAEEAEEPLAQPDEPQPDADPERPEPRARLQDEAADAGEPGRLARLQESADGLDRLDLTRILAVGGGRRRLVQRLPKVQDAHAGQRAPAVRGVDGEPGMCFRRNRGAVVNLCDSGRLRVRACVIQTACRVKPM